MQLNDKNKCGVPGYILNLEISTSSYHRFQLILTPLALSEMNCLTFDFSRREPENPNTGDHELTFDSEFVFHEARE